jgi:hypothetical protein
MDTILIAQRNTAFAEQLATELRCHGFRVVLCPGPWPPVERCIRCDKGYCPLTEAADLMIYDPQLTALDQEGRRYNLAIDSALAHPDVPMLLRWSPQHVPDIRTLRTIQTAAPNVRVAATDTELLVRQIRAQLAATKSRPEVTTTREVARR